MLPVICIPLSVEDWNSTYICYFTSSMNNNLWLRSCWPDAVPVAIIGNLKIRRTCRLNTTHKQTIASIMMMLLITWAFMTSCHVKFLYKCAEHLHRKTLRHTTFIKIQWCNWRPFRWKSNWMDVKSPNIERKLLRYSSATTVSEYLFKNTRLHWNNGVSVDINGMFL
jgi:hypothetical protein